MQYLIYGAGGLMMVAAITVGTRVSVRVWRNPSYAEILTQAGRVLPFGYATSRGVTRGTMLLWAGVGFIGAGTVAAAALPSRPVHAALSALSVGMVCYALGVASLALNLWIVWFNRPWWLVPPHMLGEEGLISEWWRCRSLGPAQRRDAARARRRCATGNPSHTPPSAQMGRIAMSTVSGKSAITLSRVRGGWRDRLRRYRIIIDGEEVASIKRGQRLELPVPPGRHTVFLQISWARSPQLEVDVAAGEAVALECKPTNIPPFGPGANAYIDLRHAT